MGTLLWGILAIMSFSAWQEMSLFGVVCVEASSCSTWCFVRSLLQLLYSSMSITVWQVISARTSRLLPETQLKGTGFYLALSIYSPSLAKLRESEPNPFKSKMNAKYEGNRCHVWYACERHVQCAQAVPGALGVVPSLTAKLPLSFYKRKCRRI